MALSERILQCDCRPEINFSVQFADFKVLDPKSHDYQFQGFIYACVMLFNYFSLTTFIMIKLMLLKPAREQKSLGVDESKKASEDVLKQFQEREKKVNEAFEIEVRRQVKQQMINQLQSIRTLPAYTSGLIKSTFVETSSELEAQGSSTAANAVYRHEEEEHEEEEEDIEIWRTRYEWEHDCHRRYERRMGISSYESEGDDESMAEYLL